MKKGVVPGHDAYNIGTYCGGILSRRTILLIFAVLLFLRYMASLFYWVIFAKDLSDKDRMTHCHGIRCPGAFTCIYQHDTTVFARYGVEVLIGTVCTFLGALGIANWNEGQTRVFARYMMFIAVFQIAVMLADLLYVEVCGTYPANILSLLPVMFSTNNGFLRRAETHAMSTGVIDDYFGYDVDWWYGCRAIVYSAVCALVSYESFVAASLFTSGPIGLGPNFKLYDSFAPYRPGRSDFRPDLHRLHETDPVAGYGSMPEV